MTAHRIHIRPVAQHDLDNLTDYFLAQAGADTAARFVERARTSFIALSRTPGLGPPALARTQKLAGLRKWRVEGFPKILIFYLPLSNGVRIIRVLHAAADWWSLLDID